jgi:tetratricopeptide (TPR) repeat protein
VSPTGIVYEVGTPPRSTRYSQTAELYLSQQNWDRALQQALDGIREDPTNPLHWFQAGRAGWRLGRYAEADSLFDRAQAVYPAYELDIEPERESAWSLAFNAGVEAYTDGDVQAAMRSWTEASAIFRLRPEAHLNLGRVLVSDGRSVDAIAVYRDGIAGLQRLPATRVLDEGARRAREEIRANMEEALEDLLFEQGRYDEAEPLARARLARTPTGVEQRMGLARILDRLGRVAEATELYAAVLATPDLDAAHLMDLGVGLFHASRFVEAGEAFRRLTTKQPRSRDAWFNYANALFAAQAWAELTRVGPRLLELDPLGETAALVTAKAYLQTGDRERAHATIERVGTLPVLLDRLRLRRTGSGVALEGRVQGNGALPGSAVRVRFEFFGDAGSLGSRTVEVVAPERGATLPLTLSFDAPAAWYCYAFGDTASHPPPPSPAAAQTIRR